MVQDTTASIEFMQSHYSATRTILLAICSGTKVAIASAATNPAIDGLALWSAEPMGHLRGHGAALQRHKRLHAIFQYLRKLKSPHTWRKLLTLNVNTDMVHKALNSQETPNDQELIDETAWLAQFQHYPGRILFVHGTSDPIASVARANYNAFCNQFAISHTDHDVQGANHSYYGLHWEHQVISHTTEWIESLCGANA